MANEEQLNILRQGVNTWNAWRQAHPEIKIDFCAVDFRHKKLSRLDLRGADFSRADFHKANLIGINFNGTTLIDAWLWETQRAGWSIQGVICEAAYWDKDRKERTTYIPEEFERLYADKTKIVLHYEGGITPIEIATLPALIQRIEAAHPGCVLRLDSIQDAPNGATVTLVIDDGGGQSPDEILTMNAALETAAQDVSRYQRAWLKEAGRREQIESMYNSLIHQMMGNSQRININISGGTIHGNIAENVSGENAEVNYTKHLQGRHDD